MQVFAFGAVDGDFCRLVIRGIPAHGQFVINFKIEYFRIQQILCCLRIGLFYSWCFDFALATFSLSIGGNCFADIFAMIFCCSNYRGSLSMCAFCHDFCATRTPFFLLSVQATALFLVLIFLTITVLASRHLSLLLFAFNFLFNIKGISDLSIVYNIFCIAYIVTAFV